MEEQAPPSPVHNRGTPPKPKSRRQIAAAAAVVSPSKTKKRGVIVRKANIHPTNISNTRRSSSGNVDVPSFLQPSNRHPQQDHSSSNHPDDDEDIHSQPQQQDKNGVITIRQPSQASLSSNNLHQQIQSPIFFSASNVLGTKSNRGALSSSAHSIGRLGVQQSSPLFPSPVRKSPRSRRRASTNTNLSAPNFTTTSSPSPNNNNSKESSIRGGPRLSWKSPAADSFSDVQLVVSTKSSGHNHTATTKTFDLHRCIVGFGPRPVSYTHLTLPTKA